MLDIKGAIFDLDGTLIDSMFIWRDMASNYLKTLNIVPEADMFDKVRTLNLEDTADYFREKYGIKKTNEEMILEIDDMVEDLYFHTVEKKEHVIAFLDLLASKGVKMCIATATDRHLVEPAMKRTGLDKYIPKVFTSSETGTSKNSPEIFRNALAYLGTPLESTYVFEDSLFAIRTAKAAGFPIIGVYDRFSEYQMNEIKAMSDVFMYSFDELFHKI